MQRPAVAGPRLVCVWGSGSPGRSTVAAALAGALAPCGRVALVDADLRRGALGTLLGGTLGSALLLTPPGGPIAPDHLQAHRGGFDLLLGVPGHGHRVPLDACALADLLDGLRTAYDAVVVDVGAALPLAETSDPIVEFAIGPRSPGP